jgi:branched-chain amino acid aminotransferase group I
MEEKIFLNGSLVPRSQARISVSDHGFLYGFGLFETMRAYHGKIFLLERHLARLLGAAETIGLKGLDANVLSQACLDTLSANSLQDARVRLTVTGGEADAFPWEDHGGRPTVVVTARTYHPFPPEKYETGFRVGIASVRRCRQSVVSSMKSTNYLSSVIARAEAAGHGLDEALLLNDDGYIAEGAVGNVFFVRSSRLVTPSLDSGILPGVTRGVVGELADSLGIVMTEGTVGLAIIKQCDEAFMTNAMIEVMPVTAVSDESGRVVNIGAGKPGTVTRKLMAAYKERVEKETARG